MRPEKKSVSSTSITKATLTYSAVQYTHTIKEISGVCLMKFSFHLLFFNTQQLLESSSHLRLDKRALQISWLPEL